MIENSKEVSNPKPSSHFGHLTVYLDLSKARLLTPSTAVHTLSPVDAGADNSVLSTLP